MSNFRDLKQIEKFFTDITTIKNIFGDKIEVVIDLTSSKYFESTSQLQELITFAFQYADEGHQVFYGIANRENDLGSKRSDENNVCTVKSFWVDIDSPDKDLPDDQKLLAAKNLLDEFVEALQGYDLEPSYIVESGNGYHVYFVLRQFFFLPHGDWEKAQYALTNLAKGDLQARNAGRLLRVPGTYNYKDKNNPKPVQIIYAVGKKFVADDFRQLVLDHGPKRTVQNVTGKTTSKQLGFIPPCIASLLDPQNKPPLGHRHLVRQVISTYAFHEGLTVEDAIQKVMHTTDDPKKAENDVRGVYQVLERDPERYSVGCGDGSNLRSLVDAGITKCDESKCQFKNPKAEKENKKKEVMSAWFDVLVDLVLDDSGKICFLVKEDDCLIIKDKHEIPEEILIPPPKETIVWKVSQGSTVINHYTSDNDGQLFNDLVEYHRNISELPSDNCYKYIAAWDMHTYLFENCEYSPINWLYAIPERGKSRTGKGCIFVAWRGIMVPTLNEAHIIRLATDHKATIFFDVRDLWKRIERSGTEDIILCRFERGAQVPRVLYPDKGAFADTKYFQVYGPTIIATNEPMDQILQTRAVQMIMPESSRTFEVDVKPEMGVPYRERLVAFRARWMDKQLPAADKPVKGRLGDILRPIRQIVNIVCQDETWFLDFVKYVDENRKIESKDSQDAIVVSAIIEAIPCVKHNHLLHTDTLEIINRHRPEQFRMSPQSLGRITARLGFERYSSGDGRGIKLDEDLLNRLCNRYGIEWKKREGILTI